MFHDFPGNVVSESKGLLLGRGQKRVKVNPGAGRRGRGRGEGGSGGLRRARTRPTSWRSRRGRGPRRTSPTSLSSSGRPNASRPSTCSPWEGRASKEGHKRIFGRWSQRSWEERSPRTWWWTRSTCRRRPRRVVGTPTESKTREGSTGARARRGRTPRWEGRTPRGRRGGATTASSCCPRSARGRSARSARRIFVGLLGLRLPPGPFDSRQR